MVLEKKKSLKSLKSLSTLKNDLENIFFVIFGGSVDNIGRRFEKKVRCFFDKWSVLNFFYDVQPEIQILTD